MPGRSRSPGRGRAGDIQCRKSRQLLHLCCSGEFYLGFPRSDLQGVSWYRLLHWECTREAQTKHRLSKYNKNYPRRSPSPLGWIFMNALVDTYFSKSMKESAHTTIYGIIKSIDFQISQRKKKYSLGTFNIVSNIGKIKMGHFRVPINYSV